MAPRVTLIPGDGIGPERAEATRRVLDATGIEFDWEVVDAGEAGIGQHGAPHPAQVPAALPPTHVRAPALAPRADPAQRGRDQGPDHAPGRGGLPERQRHAPPGAGPLREPPPGPL